jgi:hypothetical protein
MDRVFHGIFKTFEALYWSENIDKMDEYIVTRSKQGM